MFTLSGMGDFRLSFFDDEDTDFWIMVVDQNNKTLYSDRDFDVYYDEVHDKYIFTGDKEADEFCAKYNFTDVQVTNVSYDKENSTVIVRINTEVHYNDYWTKGRKFEDEDYYGISLDENTVGQFLKVVDNKNNVRVITDTGNIDKLVLYDKDNKKALIKSEKRLLEDFNDYITKLSFSCEDEKFVIEI